MSIADKITSITNHLEKDYQALESVVGKVSVNKNIENIAPLLDNLWEDLPKTTGSGTSPSISDTRAGKMKVNLLGNTSQTGTPTPDNPIPVNVVSGDNEVVVTNSDGTQSTSYPINLPVENLASLETTGTSIGDVSFTKENGVIHINGTTNSSSNFYFNSFRTKSGTATYWIDVTGYTDKVSGNCFIILQQSTDNSTWSLLSDISLKSTATHQASVTLDSSKYYRIRWYTENNTFTNATIKIQLEYGNKKNSFTPYGTTPIEMCKIGTYQDKFIRNSGKNLLNLTNITTGYGDVSKTIDIGSLELTATGTSGSQYVQQTIGQLDSTKSYTFKCNAKKIVKGTDGYPRIMIKLFGSNDNSTYTEIETIQEANPTQGQEYVLTKTLTGYSYYKLYYYNNAHTPVTIGEKTLYYNLMLNEGSTALPYEPYGNGDLYLEKHIGKVVLDGSEEGWVATTSDTIKVPNTISSLIKRPINQDALPYVYCSHLTTVTWNANWNNLTSFIAQATQNDDMRIRVSNPNMSLADFKTWLANNLPKLYFVLNTPTYTKIEGTLKDELDEVWRAYSYKGQTNITQSNNDLPFELSITALEG